AGGMSSAMSLSYTMVMFFPVMAGFVPAIHVFLLHTELKDVDARHKAGHDAVVRLVITPGPRKTRRSSDRAA
ncbi:MAG TPA: hypothetical protein VMR17_18230, partial [Xanthobacteraceae bacterium]|nr:hypothetical protein [Xanthobacteraceae bacterium]